MGKWTPEVAPESDETEEMDLNGIEMIFDAVLSSGLGPEPLKFIESLYETYETSRTLSKRQYGSLMKFYRNLPLGKLGGRDPYE